MGEQSPSPSNASVQEELGESGAQEEGGGGLLDFLLGGGSGVGGAPAAPPGDADGGPPASPGAPGAPGAYVVQAGDTVGNIAERGTGDRGKYVELNAHNLRAPNDGDLEPGDVLRIPAGWDLAALQRSGSQAPGPASAGAAEAGFDPTAALPPLIQVQMLLGQDGDADKDDLAELWAQMSEGEQQALLSMGPLAEEARRVLELPADAPADAGFMQVVLDVASALSSGYSKFLGTGEAKQATDTEAVAPAPVVEAPPVHEDGFDEGMAQEHIDAMIEGYMGVEVNGVEVATEYRNTATRSGYHDPVYGGLDEPTMYRNHPEMYYAIMGKA